MNERPSALTDAECRAELLTEIAATQASRIAELEAALRTALGYCDGAIHQTDQYRDERGELLRILHNE